MNKIVVSREKFDQALKLYGMEAYDHLVIEGSCSSHVWKMRNHTTENFAGQIAIASAWSECEDCGETKDLLNLID